MNQNTNRRIWITLVVIATLCLGAWAISSLSQRGAINPNKDSALTAGEGRDYAALYQHSEVYEAVDKNEDVLSYIRFDMMTFARTTRPEFANRETLVGFTFDKKFEKDGETFVFTGQYYGVRDKIQVKLAPQGRGVYTLSITNLGDGTNIDDSLSMNGKRNRFIKTLPKEEGRYSIRYQLTHDRIVVSFYDGYTNQDVDEVVTTLVEGLGDEVNNNVVYSINRIGIVPIEKVRENLVNPLPLP